ncbi:conserved hypothetical protein [Paraburkholderia caribensis]|jgi:hypothetical protein|nr:conserved hypothetical protein [Paraburkholderia caribensis]
MTAGDSREEADGLRATRGILLRNAQGCVLLVALFVPACRMTCAAASQRRPT